MSLEMKSLAILCATLVAAACGSSKPTTDPVVTSSTTDPTTTAKPDPAPVDPTYAARVAYSNPGGMWMPQQMTLPGHQDTFRALGVEIPAAQLADPLAAPLNAVVKLNGCTGSFVSPDGLIITNHHCVQSALEYNATSESDFVENGFLAKTRAEEPSAGPTQRVYVVQAFTDVTAKMRDGLDAIADPVKRKDEHEKRSKDLVAGCEKGRPGIRCNIAGYFGGGQYLLIENLEIRDVRLVYAPKRSIGNYGGEKDNWHWPRHTGDYSFYRAYVGKDGLPADFDPANEPFHPKHHLKVSTTGVANHDFVMVAGYPGVTTRTATAATIQHDVEWFYPYNIEYLTQRYKVDAEMASAGGTTGIKAGVDQQRTQNYKAKYTGVLDGLKANPDMLPRKAALDAKIKEWAAQPGHEDIKAQIEKYEALLAEKRQSARVDADRAKAYTGSKLLATALGLVRWAEERPKPDAERKPGYQARDLANAISSAKGLLRTYDRALDRAMWKLALVRALDLPEADRPWLAIIVGTKKGQKVDEAAIDARLDALYATSKLEDEKLRLDLLQKGTTKQLKASKDPFIKLAVALWPLVKAQEKKDDARAGELLLVSKSYAHAMREVLGGLLAPDANGTLRITYGTVKSFTPDGTTEADWPFTTTAQLLKKNQAQKPFDAPAEELEAIKAKDYGSYALSELGGEVPVNYLSDLDITNGNSGSATLDGKGDLVGLAFDGTLAGVASDVVFNSATTRTIHCDIRYALWIMDAIDGADHLLTEMAVPPSID